MLKSFRNPAAIAAVLAVTAASLVTTPADAQQVRRRGGNGAGIAAGVIGGLAAGAILGGALSNRGGYVDPGYAEDGYGAGYGGGGYGGGCPLVREPVYDGAGRFAGYRAVPSC